MLVVGNTLFLGFWTAGSIPGFRQGDYMAVYTGFGVASAVFSFLLFVAFAWVCSFSVCSSTN